MRIILGSIFVLAVMSGCQAGPAGSASSTAGETIATINGKTITATDLRAKLDEQSPFVRAHFKAPDKKKEFVENLVRFEILLQEARQRGLENDKEVKSMIDRVMVQRLMRLKQEELEKSGGPVPEADLKKYYDEHLNEFVKPAKVRVSQIFVASAKDDSKHARVKETTNKLLTQLKNKEAGTEKTAFAQYATAHSEDATSKQVGGDLGFKTQEELTKLWGEAFAAAAMSLKTAGEFAELVESDKGFHLIKLTARQEAVEKTFDMAKPRIESRLAMERRSRAIDEYVNGLKSKANVQINEQALAKVEFDATPTTATLPSMTPAPTAPVAPAQPRGPAPTATPAVAAPPASSAPAAATPAVATPPSSHPAPMPAVATPPASAPTQAPAAAGAGAATKP